MFSPFIRIGISQLQQVPQNKTVAWDYTMVCAGKYIYLIKKRAVVWRLPPNEKQHFEKTKYEGISSLLN
jgi:hypothetical protein